MALSQETLSPSTILIVWWSSLALLAVVILVVATLLTVIRNTAAGIRGGAAAIWTQGKLVANNTIQIPLLMQITLRAVGRIRAAAGQIAGATGAIQRHAETCPGCPHCVLGGGLGGGA